MSDSPLSGIRVLDLTRMLAGPYCTMLLGDMGAEVIKVEQPGKGDDTRAFGPPFIEGESAYFLSINRNKKSVIANVMTDNGKEIVKRLIKTCDVIVENFRPGFLENLGLGYEEIKKINPGIIYASISGFGLTGPEKMRAGFDLVVQGMSGLMSITGESDGRPNKVGTSISDILSGIYAYQGILLALISRQKTGKGQKVDVSLLDSVTSLLTYQAGIHFATGAVPQRIGNQHPTICPYETFQASDGYVNIAVGNNWLWKPFCKLMGLDDIRDDPRFESNPKRVENRDQLFPIIQKIVETKTADEWLKMFDEAGIPAGPILTIDKVLSHPQVLAREMVVDIEHPKAGSIKVTGIPVKLSETPGTIRLAPPTLGQHNQEILEELGFTPEEIQTIESEEVT